MMYEHPLMEGDRECCVSDTVMHDICIGGYDSEDEPDDDYSRWRLVPPKKQTFSQACQTEPWEPPQAPAEPKTERLVILRTGRHPANLKIRPSLVHWPALSPNSPAPPDVHR